MRQVINMKTEMNREMSSLDAYTVAEGSNRPDNHDDEGRCFYKQACDDPKVRQVKWEAGSRKRWAYWASHFLRSVTGVKLAPSHRYLSLCTLAIISLLAWCSTSYAVSSADGTYTLNSAHGRHVWTGDLETSSSNDRSVSAQAAAAYGSMSLNQYMLWGSSSDGVIGVVLAPDVIITLEGSYSGSTTSLAAQSASWTFTAGKDPVLKSGTDAAFFPNCLDDWFPVCLGTTTRTGMMVVSNYSGHSSIRPALWIGPQAQAGTYVVPSIHLMSGGYALSAGQITLVENTMECVISAPPVIDFGTVNIFGRDFSDDTAVLGSYSGSLGISCTAGVPDAESSATVSVLGNTGRYTRTLALTLEDGSPSPAEIRGYMGSGIPNEGLCEGGGLDSWLAFGNPDRKIPIGSLSVGYNAVPYNFSLCPNRNPSNVTGRASATATINVSWD